MKLVPRGMMADAFSLLAGFYAGVSIKDRDWRGWAFATLLFGVGFLLF